VTNKRDKLTLSSLLNFVSVFICRIKCLVEDCEIFVELYFVVLFYREINGLMICYKLCTLTSQQKLQQPLPQQSDTAMSTDESEQRRGYKSRLFSNNWNIE